MLKNCILNFATRTSTVYNRGQKRLVESLKQHGYKGDIITWQKESEFGCPPHGGVPYAFKPYALKWARDKGYNAALWLDASFWAVKPIGPLFGIMEDKGYLMQNDGNRIGHWTHDKCLEKYDLTRDQAMKMKMYSAGCTGINFKSDLANQYLDEWFEAANDGESFKGQWTNKYKTMSSDPRCRGHRHDMSVGSILAHKLGMEYEPAWSIFTYGRDKNFPNVYLICRGY